MISIGWRLVLEPTSMGLAWSLMWDDGTEVDADAGLHPTPGPWEDLVGSLVPAATDTSDLWNGPLADWERELAAGEVLGAALLPQRLRDRLLRPDTRHTVTVATRGWCSAVPWDALVIDEVGTRLVERCRLLAEPHPLAEGHEIERQPPAAGGGGVVVIDPGPVAGLDEDLRPLYPGHLPEHLLRTLEEEPADVVAQGRRGTRSLSVEDLAEVLASRSWDRLLFAGHVRPGTADNPSRVALVLSRGREPDFLSAYDWLGDPMKWPAPRRVALIGCGSGDGRPPEEAGLPLAALLAGAELVTATRWTVPSDLSDHEHTFGRLVEAVCRAHRQPDPVGYLRDWQITELFRWRLTQDPAHAPLTWAALTTAERARRAPGQVDHDG